MASQPYGCSGTQTPVVRERGDYHPEWLAPVDHCHSLLLLRLTRSGTVTPEWDKVDVALSALLPVMSVHPAPRAQQTLEKDMTRQDERFSGIKHHASITKT